MKPFYVFSARRFLVLALTMAVACTFALVLTSSYASPKDHELARQALQQGKVLPLRTVLDQVERQYQGQVVKIEFEHEDGRFIYEMRLLHPNGQVSKLEVDAVDGRTLRMRKKEDD